MTPIPLLIHCPVCHLQHVDRGEWATRPHREHLCTEIDASGKDIGCGTPFSLTLEAPTVGVQRLPGLAQMHRNGPRGVERVAIATPAAPPVQRAASTATASATARASAPPARR